MADLVYHGTPFRFLDEILGTGFLLSPWDKKIAFLSAVDAEVRKREGSGIVVWESQGMSLEDFALKLAISDFSEYEIEHRVKSVSFAESFLSAKTYATGKEGCREGAVLGFAKPSRYFQGRNGFLYVPRRHSLDDLREVKLYASSGAEKIVRKIRVDYPNALLALHSSEKIRL